MHQRNVQQWASTLRQSHRNHLQPPNVNEVNVGSENGLRNVSATIKTRENNDNRRYSFTLNFKPPKKDFNRSLKPQFYTFDMTTKDEQKLHSPSDVQLCDNHTLDLLTPSSDHHDIDALSDAGTYIIEDDVDMAQNNNSEPKMNASSLHRRYVNQTRNRHGTFDIQGLKPATEHTIDRPLVDLNTPTHDLSSSSSSSSLISPLVENDFSILNSFTHAPTTLLQQQSTQNQIKPAECFVISPAFETKLFPTTNISRRKAEPPWKSKLPTKSVPNTDVNLEILKSQSSSPPLSARSNQGITEKYYTQPRKKPSSAKTSIQPHTAINDQPHSASSFVRNSPIRQTVPGNAHYQRQTISSAMINNNDGNETTSNLTKVYANKSFILRQQRSNLLPSTPKMIEQQQTISKHTTSILSSITNSSGQTNRAVELRRANAQAKIEELSQRTRKHLHKPNQPSDIMSVSWHSNGSSTSKTNLRSDPRTTRSNIAPERQDMLATRTISSSSNNRSTSESPNRLDETSSRYRKAMISSFTDSQHSQRMTASTTSIGGERCDSLRDNGQRLAIKLIQLSSNILEKLKSNDDTSLLELEQLVDKLQTVKRTLSTIDALLTGPTNDDASI